MTKQENDNPNKPEGHHLKEEMDKPVENPGMTKGIRNIIILLGVLIAIGVIGFIIYHLLAGRNNDATDTAEQIRQTFETPSTNNMTSNASVFIPPHPGSWTGPATATSTKDQTTLSSSGTTAPTAWQHTTDQPQAVGPNVYQSPVYGFSCALPMGWIADDRQAPGQVLFYDKNTGRLGGYAEIYDAGSVSLDSLALSLIGSPDISSIAQTTFAGQPAVSYLIGSDNGIATIYNGRIYYLRGVPASSANFQFMN